MAILGGVEGLVVKDLVGQASVDGSDLLLFRQFFLRVLGLDDLVLFLAGGVGEGDGRLWLAVGAGRGLSGAGDLGVCAAGEDKSCDCEAGE